MQRASQIIGDYVLGEGEGKKGEAILQDIEALSAGIRQFFLDISVDRAVNSAMREIGILPSSDF